ncbi:MAG: hypothetical protein IT285_14925 [Bdellovibrionales bacterium]|nr:hypothetical protein [Bdellovibrionales bacterium]
MGWFTAGLIFVVQASSAHGACGDSLRATPAYQAVDACDQMRAASGATSTAAALRALQAAGTCSTDASVTGTTDLRRSVCADPGGFVCRNGGRVIDSECRLSNYNLDEFAATPEAVAASCAAREAALRTLGDQKSLCVSNPTSDVCRAAMVSRREEFSRAEHDAVYTSSRRTRVTQMFNRVRDQYVAMIQASTRIPQAHKQGLVDRINSTVLDLDARLYCSDTGLSDSARLPVGAYNYPAGGHAAIEVCIGTMANLERMNPYSVMWILAHELSHSIDPCNLEQDALRAAPDTGAPHQADRVFPGLARCLRGGAGARACTRAIIRCNEVPASERRLLCIQELERSGDVFRPPPEDGEASTALIPSEDQITACLTRFDRTPSCAIHGDHTHHQSQLPESFSDFMGAEVVARILSQDTAAGALDAQGQLDALASIAAADGSGSAPNCEAGSGSYATRDRYARGHTRVNRLLMGSAAFRAAVGCPAARAPATRDGGATCRGF